MTFTCGPASLPLFFILLLSFPPSLPASLFCILPPYCLVLLTLAAPLLQLFSVIHKSPWWWQTIDLWQLSPSPTDSPELVCELLMWVSLTVRHIILYELGCTPSTMFHISISPCLLTLFPLQFMSLGSTFFSRCTLRNIYYQTHANWL